MTYKYYHPSEQLQFTITEFSRNFYAIFINKYPFFLCLVLIFYAIDARLL